MIGPRNQPASSLNEGQARYILIDPALRGAGWNLEDRTQVGFEIPVDGYDATPWNGVTDYCLYAPGGEVIAVVEAKRCSRNPREADEQLRHYVTEIAKHQSYAPFGFMTNGLQTWFWEVGLANPRVVAGFFAPQDLQRLLFLRLNARPLPSLAINTSIVDRPYQHEAIRRVAESFARPHLYQYVA
ncbi:MAG: type I restriction endonuclease [Burkholderiales bacterium]